MKDRLMRALALCALLAASMAGLSTTAAAEPAKTPVVVELFTSQGCNTCPPADEILGRLAGREDVIALSLNVDYWDYLGWKDRFAKPEHTARQRAYKSALGGKYVYTPQMVIHGRQGVIGNQEMVVRQAVAAQRAAPIQARIALERVGDVLAIEISPAQGPSAAPRDEARVVWLFGYSARMEQSIGRGENSGRTIAYHNVAREMRRLGDWSGGAARFDAPIDPRLTGYAVVVQDGVVGPVIGAAKLEF